MTKGWFRFYLLLNFKVGDRTDSVDKKISKLEADLVKYKNQMKKMRNGPAKNAVKQKALMVLRQKKRCWKVTVL